MVVIIATLTFHDSQVLLQGCIVHYGTDPMCVCLCFQEHLHACMHVRRLDDNTGSLVGNFHVGKAAS